MRLIDADEFEKFIEQKYSEGETTNDIKDQMLFDLSCQATVFDLDKVVKNGGLDNRDKNHVFEVNDKNKIKELETLSVNEKLKEQSYKVTEKYKIRSGGDN